MLHLPDNINRFLLAHAHQTTAKGGTIRVSVSARGRATQLTVYHGGSAEGTPLVGCQMVFGTSGVTFDNVSALFVPKRSKHTSTALTALNTLFGLV